MTGYLEDNIHCDLHVGNFFLDRGKITFFDFDDCCYQWFAYDIATVLFYAVLEPWVPNERSAQEEEAKRFLPAFLKGYQREFPLPDFVLEQLPLFLKLRELSLYALIHRFLDVENLTDCFTIKFMEARRERIENEDPVLVLSS